MSWGKGSQSKCWGHTQEPQFASKRKPRAARRTGFTVSQRKTNSFCKSSFRVLKLMLNELWVSSNDTQAVIIQMGVCVFLITHTERVCAVFLLSGGWAWRSERCRSTRRLTEVRGRLCPISFVRRYQQKRLAGVYKGLTVSHGLAASQQPESTGRWRQRSNSP